MIKQLIEVGRQIVAANMVKGWGGNLSGRFQDRILITRTGADLGQLTESDFVSVRFDPPPTHTKKLMPQPSSEVMMHLTAYQSSPTVQAVLHAHPPKAIALGLTGRPLPALTPDFYLHVGPVVPLVPYITPTTEALATAVSHHLPAVTSVLLQNHGVLVTGNSVSQALLRLMLIEEQATIYLDALAVGSPRLLTAEDMQQLDEITGGKYRAMANK